MTPELWLLEDSARARWFPLADTRPIGEIRFGALLLRERIEKWAGLSARGHLAPKHLTGFSEPDASRVLHPRVLQAEGGEGPNLVLCNRWVPDTPSPPRGRLEFDVLPRPTPGFPIPVVVAEGGEQGGSGVGWLLAPGDALPALEDGNPTLPDRRRVDELRAEGREPFEVEGSLLPDLWTLMAETPTRLVLDLTDAGGGTDPDGGTVGVVRGESWDGGSAPGSPGPPPRGVHALGDYPIRMEGAVEVGPNVVLDAREGPIHLSAGVRVEPFTHLAGPLWVGRDTRLLGGRIAGSTIGPVCRIRGEVEASVIHGFTNKAHDGYLGHAVVGSWVNLGAGTTNSDLKNNYGSVRLELEGKELVDTGALKIGVFLGDHVKTGIGTLFNTGTLVGAGSNLFGGPMPPQRVPPFSWGTGDRLVPYRLDRFLESAQRVMARRDQRLPRASMDLFEALWERTHGPVVR